MLINYLVKEIILFDDKMTIIYNTPKTMNLDASQGFLFIQRTYSFQYTYKTRYCRE